MRVDIKILTTMNILHDLEEFTGDKSELLECLDTRIDDMVRSGDLGTIELEFLDDDN